jgi:membrane-bound metal-dependent hydrolase YbcI (DUF457 family)
MQLGALISAIFINVNSLLSPWGIFMYLLQIVVGGIVAVIPDFDHPKAMLNEKVLASTRKYFLMIICSAIGLVFIYYWPGFKGYFIGLFVILIGYTRHRGFTHSIIAMIWFYLILRSVCIVSVMPENLLSSLLSILSVFKTPYFWKQAILKGGVIGYISHPGTDALTDHGAELLWPNKKNFKIVLFDEKNKETLYTILICILIVNVILQVM